MTAPPTAEAQSPWRVVKKYLQPEVQVLEETATHLVLYHAALQDTLILGEGPEGAVDVYGVIRERRGSNPHRVWFATAQFWNDPDRPKSTWGSYFRAGFLRIIRPPES